MLREVCCRELRGAWWRRPVGNRLRGGGGSALHSTPAAPWLALLFAISQLQNIGILDSMYQLKRKH